MVHSGGNRNQISKCVCCTLKLPHRKLLNEMVTDMLPDAQDTDRFEMRLWPNM